MSGPYEDNNIDTNNVLGHENVEDTMRLAEMESQPMSESEMPARPESQNTKTLFVRKGDSFSVNLWEDRTRGEQWVPTYDAKVLILIEDEFLRTMSNNAVDSGRRRFEFQALEPGQYKIELSKRMAWKFTAEDRRIFIVNVQA